MSSLREPQPGCDSSAGEEHWEALSLELAKRTTPLEQEVFLSEHPQIVEKAVLDLLAEAIRAAFRSDVPRALKLADSALLIALKLGDQREIALALRAKANALWLTGQCREALKLFDQAVGLLTKIPDLQEVGRTLSTSIQSYLLLGEYQAAFSAAEEARRIFEELGDTLRLARLEINVANIYHRQNHFADALDAYERAYRQLLPHAEIEGIAVALHNAAVCRIALNDFRGTLEAYQRLRSLCEAHGMPLLVAQADYNSAFLYFLRGDYTQALALLQASREIYRKNSDDYHLGLCDVDQSEIYVELGLSEEAIEMAQLSCDRFKRLGTPYEVGRSLASLAIALGQQARFSRALETFKQAKEVFLEEENLAWSSLLDLYCAAMLFEEGRWAEAANLCGPALELFRSEAMPGKELQALLLLSRIKLRQADLEGAASLCASAMGLVNELELPALTFQARLLQGEIQEALGDPEAAFEAYQSCRKALETMRSGLHADELKIGLMKSRVEVYEKLATLCLARQGNVELAAEEAFGYVEEAKSRSLRDLIFNRAGISEEAKDAHEPSIDWRLADLRKELNWYYHRIEREELSKERIGPKLVNALREQARLRERELLRLEREQPEVQESGITENSRPASVAEVRASLKPGTVMIAFFAIEKALSAAVISSEALHVRPLAKVTSVQQHMRLLNFQMNKIRLGAEYVQRFQPVLLQSAQAHLRALYGILIAPLRDLLQAEHLVIVPWGPLHSLPFHALLDGERYLIEQFSISYAPSASYIACRGLLGTARQGVRLFWP